MRVLDKKLFRTYREHWAQVLAIVAVVVCGTACFIALNSAMKNLRLTRDSYFEQYRLADFEIMLERAPRTSVFKIENIPGVREAQARIVQDVKAEMAGVDEARILRLISMPDTERPVINDIHMVRGRYFADSSQEEVILSERFAEANELTIGDRVTITLNNKKHSLRVVGHALTPEYVWMIRNAQELIPSPERFGILWVSQTYAETMLDMDGACNNIVGAVENREQLNAILDKAEDILDPYGVFATVKQDEQASYQFLEDEITGLTISARTVPPLFMGISALILLIILNRMVRNERTQIGLLKAYGHSNGSIAAHYFKYSVLLCIVGAAGGIALGQWLARGMMGIYADFYQFPILRSRFYPEVVSWTILISVLAGLLGAMLAALRAVQIAPAESMRPVAPRSGKRIWIERITAVWRRLGFTWKMVFRNTARNRLRAAFNVAGIMLSMAIVLVGHFLWDSFTYMFEFQYELTQREDITVSFETERDKAALNEVSRFDNVRRAEPLLRYPFELRSAWREKDVVIFGLQRDSHLYKVLDDDERVVDIGDRGLVLPERLANRLAVGLGDQVTLKPLMGRITDEKNVTVSQIVPQFFGVSAYMNIDALSRVLDEPLVMNAALLDIAPGKTEDVNRWLKDVPAVSAVEVKADVIANIDGTMKQSMWIMNVMIIGFAGVIAFAIIYNVTMVSLTERQRELASLRVLGFSRGEVSRVMYLENTVLSLMGVALGVPLGNVLTRWIAMFYDTDLYRMPFKPDPTTYLMGFALIAVFVLVANAAVGRRIHRIDLVEALKAPE